MAKCLRSSALKIALGVVLVTAPARATPSADKIVAHYIDAIGGQAACDAIQNIIIRGSYTENGETHSAELARLRPFYKLVGDPLRRSMDFAEGYDGSAWEFYGDPGVVLRTVGPASAATRHGMYILGNLVDYKAQGSTVALIGTAMIDRQNTYQLRVHMMDGYEQDEFVDTKSWLIIADRKVAKVHAFGADIPSETQWSDYRRVHGVLFAFRNSEVEIVTGKQLNEFQAQTIDVNLDITPAMFMPPAIKQTPVQILIDQLFQERADNEAVLWTYHDFRIAYPRANTDDAVQFIGYQILKMGNTSTAVSLLEHNVAAYPNSSGAAFGLGRAYLTALRSADAKREFERALSLDSNNKRAQSALTDFAAAR